MELIAHRGASAVAPESTQAAIREAIKAGAVMIEIDVQLTKDGKPVIFHDERLERTTNGAGRLSGKTYRELQALDSGSWFGRQFRGQRILSLARLFEITPKRITLNLELKRTPRRQALIRAVKREIKRAARSRSVVLSSFDHKLIAPFKRTRIHYALISKSNPKSALRRAIGLGCQAWHARDNIISAKLVDVAHAAGLKARVWTVDSPERARQLKGWQVDGIFTNNPARLKGVVQ